MRLAILVFLFACSDDGGSVTLEEATEPVQCDQATLDAWNPSAGPLSQCDRACAVMEVVGTAPANPFCGCPDEALTPWGEWTGCCGVPAGTGRMVWMKCPDLPGS